MYDYLKELVKYDKLSRSKKFEHISDSPILQKQLPLCWAAFNDDAEAYFILNEASTMMQAITDHPLAIFNDLAVKYSARRQTQLKIIGNATQHIFMYRSLQQLPNDFDFDNAIYLTEKTDLENELKIAIIQTKENTTIVYQGTVSLGKTAKVELSTAVEPYLKKTEHDFVRIQTYSVQGNNDYPFAETHDYFVSMPENNVLSYASKITQEVKHVQITDNDERKLNLKKDDIEIISDLVLKYLPKSEEGEHDEA